MTNLSPHIFALFEPDPNEAFPWSYYSENSYLGKRINVDMAGAIRAIERMSGKKFIFYSDIKEIDPQIEKREELKKAWIAENTREVELSKENAFTLVDVAVEDRSQVVGEKVTYTLEGREVIEVRNPEYAKKIEQKWQLKEGVRFDTETGRFFQTVVPVGSEAEAAIPKDSGPGLSKWIKDRL